MFDTGLLRTFLAVADCGGFTNAARLLNSTQSTVSAQIQRLRTHHEIGPTHFRWRNSSRLRANDPPFE